MIIKIDGIEIDNQNITGLEIKEVCNKFVVLITTKSMTTFSFKIKIKDLDISEFILNDRKTMGKYLSEFQTRLFRDLIDLLFGDYILQNTIELQSRAEMISEMIHNSL